MKKLNWHENAGEMDPAWINGHADALTSATGRRGRGAMQSKKSWGGLPALQSAQHFKVGQQYYLVMGDLNDAAQPLIVSLVYVKKERMKSGAFRWHFRNLDANSCFRNYENPNGELTFDKTTVIMVKSLDQLTEELQVLKDLLARRQRRWRG